MFSELKEIWTSGHLEFEYPWMLWLILAPILILALKPLRYRAESLFAPFFDEIIRLKQEKPTKGVQIAKRNPIALVLLLLVWISLVCAAASPQLIGEPEKQIKTARNFLINVDISLSMETRDWVNQKGVKTTRWEAVKEVMAEFISRRKGDRMGLILFGSQAYLQTPFTDDLEVVESLLKESEVGMAGAKTAIGNSIGKAVELFEQDSIQKKVMVLITDGADSGSELKPIQAARLAAADSIVIYTIGIGTTEAQIYELDEYTLTEIAKATTGQYFKASDRERLEQVYDELDQLEPIEYENKDYIPKRLLFYYPLIVAFIAALGYHLIMGIGYSFRLIFYKPKEYG
ncbi:vWA domain-containing protein [Eudoraea chungangensis]|uniref:vWA domain-containing protein n=1 Tax=Eudoraea chungangensis TaxID=1481905 RepID=UPI0023ECA3C4